MAKRRDEMDSAMGPDEEPGEAHPARADEALGLGGPGTEGKPGSPEGGTEPQIPQDVVPPTREEEKPFEVLREAAEEINREEFIEKGRQTEAVSDAKQRVTPPPTYFPATASERRAEAGETGQDLKRRGAERETKRPQVGGGPGGIKSEGRAESPPEVRPEGIKPDEGSPGEKIRRKAG